jgi:hypothetical protein
MWCTSTWISNLHKANHKLEAFQLLVMYGLDSIQFLVSEKNLIFFIFPYGHKKRPTFGKGQPKEHPS